MLDSLHRAGREWRITFESASLDAILAAVQSGLGIAALPVVAIQDFALTRFHAIPLPGPPVVEFGMFRAATGMSSRARTIVPPILDGSTEIVTVEQLTAGRHAGMGSPRVERPSPPSTTRTVPSPLQNRRCSPWTTSSPLRTAGFRCD